MKPRLRALLPALALLAACCQAGCPDPSTGPSDDLHGDARAGDTSHEVNLEVVLSEPQPTLPLLALTPHEYNNTVRDLFGFSNEPSLWPDAPPVATEIAPQEGEKAGLFGSVPITPPDWPREFPAEVGVDDFEGMADGQVPSAYGIEELQKAALFLAPYALVSPLFFTCTDWGDLPQDERETCGWESVERLTQRAWRRPMSADERERLRSLWQDNWNQSTPEQAVALTIAGVLQSPAFLFRIEEGDTARADSSGTPLTAWELASRLSYFLWDSMPDPELFAAASQGELDSVEGIEVHARRMLTDPRARQMVTHFHHQWLGTDDVLKISPARREYGPLYGIAPTPPLDTTGDGAWPGILGPVRHSMKLETSLFVESVIFEGAGTLEALLTETRSYMSVHTYPIYGDHFDLIEGPSVFENIGLVIFSQGSSQSIELYPVEHAADKRAGLLTLPSVLAIGAYSVHPAPIQRGKRILERLACEELGVPLPGAEAALPPDSQEVEATNRERTEAATSGGACVSCHTALNPPGFAFENYDAMGRYREEDNGFPVDASGTVDLWGGETLTFEDGVDFAHQLAATERVRDCYALRWTRYAAGVDFAEGDEEVLPLQEAFRSNDNVQELLVAIATSDFFRYRVLGGKQ